LAIQYFLLKNGLKNGGNYSARVSWRDTTNRAELVENMMKLGAPGTVAEIMALLDYQDQAIISEIKKGNRVDNELTVYCSSIKGIFEREDSPFSPNAHNVQPTAGPGSKLRNALLGFTEVERLSNRNQNQSPYLKLYFNYATREENNVVTPGEPARLDGNRMQFDHNDLNQGIFFVRAYDSSTYRVSMVMEGGPRRIMFKTPNDLTPGEYYLTIRTKVDDDGNRLVGELRFQLTVPDPVETETQLTTTKPLAK
jgi:hypothetical protein